MRAETPPRRLARRGTIHDARLARASARIAHLLLFALVGAPSIVAAQPRLHVRSETRLELSQERVATGVRLRGMLLDDLGVPLAARELVVEVRATEEPLRRERLRTDREGRFVLEVPLGSEEVARVRALFGGDEGHERLEVEREIDGRRADVRLRLRVDDATLSLDRESHRVEGHATSAAGGQALELTLADELGRLLARATTDAAGHASFVVPSSALGGPGAGRLVLRTEGDVTRSAGRTETPVLRTRASTLVLEAPPQIAVGGRATLRGRLTDAGGPLPERAVGFFVGDEHRGSVLTRSDGSFEWRLDVTREDAPALTVVARYESDEPGHLPAQSAPLEIRVDVPAPTTAWAWVAVALCAVAAWLARSLWRREVTAVSPPRAAPTPVVLASRGSERSSTISGRLEDRDGRSLAGRVTARAADGATTSVEVEAGVPFEVTLSRGTHELVFEARGHASHRVTVSVPHRGEWRGATIRLESWRRRAVTLLRETVARAGLPTSERATIRETVAPGDAAMRALGSEVERAVYDRAAPDEATIAALETRASEVAGSRSPRAR